MTTSEILSSSFESAEEEPEPSGPDLNDLYLVVEHLEQLHNEYYGCDPRTPFVLRIGKKLLNEVTGTVEVVYRSAKEVKEDIEFHYNMLSDGFKVIDTADVNDIDQGKHDAIENELRDPGYKRFGLL